MEKGYTTAPANTSVEIGAPHTAGIMSGCGWRLIGVRDEPNLRRAVQRSW